MLNLTRIILFSLLAVFAASSAVNAAGANSMSLKMAIAGQGAMDMADCDGCGTGDRNDSSGLHCQTYCLSAHVANLSQDSSFSVALEAFSYFAELYDLMGQTSPPDPYPPKILI